MDDHTKEKIKELREKGMTYGEIKKILGLSVPKSSLSFYCKGVGVPADYQSKIKRLNIENLNKARVLAKRQQQEARNRYLKSLYSTNQHLRNKIDVPDTAKLLLASLYLAEGGKTQRGSLVFGNSDPKIIKLFLFLLRKAYTIDDRKFRCTVQCRADQDTERLKNFWSKTLGIPVKQFYNSYTHLNTKGSYKKKSQYGTVAVVYSDTLLLRTINQWMAEYSSMFVKSRHSSVGRAAHL